MAPRRNDDGFRTAMLEAGATLIAERGYHAVRIADIAAACGASTGSVHYHFTGKEDVLTAALRFAVERAVARNRDALRGIDDAHARLLRLIELQLPVGAELRAEWRIWLEYWSAAARRPELAELHRELYGGWQGLIAETVRRGQRQGVFRDGDPDALAETLTALIDGAAVHAMTGLQVGDAARMRELLVAFVDGHLVAGAGA
jgi:AcrR family transcriptional regulator